MRKPHPQAGNRREDHLGQKNLPFALRDLERIWTVRGHVQPQLRVQVGEEVFVDLHGGHAAAWVVWANSLLSLLLIFVLMKFYGLELLVDAPPVLVSTTVVVQVWALIGAMYLCIALTIFQVVFSIFACAAKYRPLLVRLYYSLVAVTATGFYVLLGSWGLILAIY